jgi:hypothetical protein
MRRFSSALVVLALASLACESPVAVQSDILHVRKAPTALELTNISSAPVYYFVVDRDLLALLDWAVCDNPATCPNVTPNAMRRVPFDSIGGYSATTREVVVYHWHLVPGNRAPGYVPDSLRAVIVTVR